MPHPVHLICPFDSDDPEFARGFELGLLWERLKDEEPCEVTIHASNVEMVMRFADVTNRPFRADDLSDEWIHVMFH